MILKFLADKSICMCMHLTSPSEWVPSFRYLRKFNPTIVIINLPFTIVIGLSWNIIWYFHKRWFLIPIWPGRSPFSSIRQRLVSDDIKPTNIRKYQIVIAWMIDERNYLVKFSSVSLVSFASVLCEYLTPKAAHQESLVEP